MNTPKSMGGDIVEDVLFKLADTRTLNAGEKARVTNVGSQQTPTLQFHIPAGPAGSIVSVAAKTLDIGQDATVENSGTNYEAALTFGIPKGVRGDKGLQGPPGVRGNTGAPATVNIGKVSVLEAGSIPTVTNSGTKTAAILDFAFPLCACMAPAVVPAPAAAAAAAPVAVSQQNIKTFFN